MGLLGGVRCFADGFTAAFHADHRKFVVLPALVSLVIISAGLWAGFSYVTELSAYLVGLLPDWLGFLQWVLQPLLYLIGILAGAWLFGFLATIIGSPFLSELALRIDRQAPVEMPWWRQIAPALLRELRKLRYHLPRLLLVLLASLIPVINVAAPVLWFIFGGWMMAVEFGDFFSENRGRAFPATLDLLRANRAAAIGFGGCAALLMAMPLLNFIAAPVAVAGGTLLMKRITASA